MRSRGTVAACTAAVVLLAAPAALADEEIVGATPNRYSNPDVTIDQGEPLTFRNTDFAMHDVTSDAAGLFASDTIGQGETSFVEGSQYLTTGSYGYYCSVHPQMKGTITVSSAGTPATRPGSGSPPDTTAPTVTVRPRPARAKLLRKGRPLKVDVGSDEGATVSVDVWVGSARAAKAKLQFTTAGSRRIEMRIRKALRKRLRKGRKLRFVFSGADQAGNVAGSQATLKLR